MNRRVFLEVMNKALAAGADPTDLARDAATSADNLNAELAQKDETIKALATMLKRLCEAIGEERGDDMTPEQLRTFGVYMEACERVESLRKTGVLK